MNLKQFNVPPAVHVVVWILFSSAVIIYNKWIFTVGGFRFPLFLTSCHLIFATIFTRILRRFTTLLNGLDNVVLTWKEYATNILIVAVFFSLSLAFSNLAYLSLSVSFIQMIKAMTPALVMVFSAVLINDVPSKSKIINVLVIVFGVMVTTYGEMELSFVGFMFQIIGIVSESIRLVLVQKLMTNNGLQLDPLCSLYYLAPICFLFNFVAFMCLEMGSFKLTYVADLGVEILVSNCIIAFGLNVAVVFLIGTTSSLVLTLCGTLKDILLIVFSVFFFGSHVSLMQFFGYSIALGGLFIYKNGSKVPTTEEVRNFLQSPKKSLILSLLPTVLLFIYLIFFGFRTNSVANDPLSGLSPQLVSPGNMEFLSQYTTVIKKKPALFFFSAGISAKQRITNIVHRIGFTRASFIVQVFDSSSWTDLDWYSNATFINAPGQTKAWGMARFLTAETVANYEYIFPWDDDIAIDDSFDFDLFIDLHRRYNIHLSQPSLEENYHFQISKRIKYSVVGHWSTFVEIMAPVIKSEAWISCVSKLFQSNMKLGWGTDDYMYRVCRSTPYCRMAVIDAYPVIHENTHTTKAVGSNLFEEGMAEAEDLKKRIGKWCREGGMRHYVCKSWTDVIPEDIDYFKIISDVDLGKSDCINFGSGYMDSRKV